MSDGLRLPEGSTLIGLTITAEEHWFDMEMWARVPGKKREYRVNVKSKTLKEALLEAGKFLDEGLGLDIQLRVKMPI